MDRAQEEVALSTMKPAAIGAVVEGDQGEEPSSRPNEEHRDRC